MRNWKSAPYALLAALSLVAALGAAPLAQPGLVFVTRAGQGPSGEPLFEVADSADPGAKRLWDKVQRDPDVRRATAQYQKIQEQRHQEIRRELMADGEFSRDDQAIMDNLPGPYPVYLEVRPGSRGAYNDWRAVFSVRAEGGGVERVAAPRIVMTANDPLIEGDIDILRQTVVHEVAHGFHAMMVGPNNTPQTPWLQQPHNGMTVSDGTLALIEGYAEFVGAHFTDRKTIAGDPQDTIPNNLYVYDENGQVKPAADLWKTEGWAATVMYRIANGSDIADGFKKINQVIARHNPSTFEEFIGAFQEEFPADAAAVRGIVSAASMQQIYPQARSGGGSRPPASEPAVLSEGGGGADIGRIVAMVGGGVVGALFGVSFGPVGIIVAGAVGVGVGYMIARTLFADSADRGSISFDLFGGDPAAPAASAEVEAPAAPGAVFDPAAAKARLDEAYRAYRKALRTGGDLPLIEANYRAAKAAYQAALSAGN